MKQAKLKGDAEKTSIDWGAVRQRVEMAATFMKQGGVSNHEEKKKILRARARALAQEIEEKATPVERLDVIEFLLSGERYGIEASYVSEVYPLRELVPVPGTPPFILGITNIRGKILSVIDIKKFFDLPEKGLTELDKIVIVQANGMELGIHADAVAGMRSIALEEIQPPLPTLTGIREKYLKGITRERLVILDTVKILSDRDIIISEGREVQ